MLSQNEINGMFVPPLMGRVRALGRFVRQSQTQLGFQCNWGPYVPHGLFLPWVPPGAQGYFDQLVAAIRHFAPLNNVQFTGAPNFNNNSGANWFPLFVANQIQGTPYNPYNPPIPPPYPIPPACIPCQGTVHTA